MDKLQAIFIGDVWLTVDGRWIYQDITTSLRWMERPKPGRLLTPEEETEHFGPSSTKPSEDGDQHHATKVQHPDQGEH